MDRGNNGVSSEVDNNIANTNINSSGSKDYKKSANSNSSGGKSLSNDIRPTQLRLTNAAS